MWIHGDSILANKPSLDILDALKSKDSTKSIWRSKQVCYNEATALLRETDEIIEELEESFEEYPPLVDEDNKPVFDDLGQPVLDTTKPAEIGIRTVPKRVQIEKGHTWAIEDACFVISNKDGEELSRWDLELMHEPDA